MTSPSTVSRLQPLFRIAVAKKFQFAGLNASDSDAFANEKSRLAVQAAQVVASVAVIPLRVDMPG